MVSLHFSAAMGSRTQSSSSTRACPLEWELLLLFFCCSSCWQWNQADDWMSLFKNLHSPCLTPLQQMCFSALIGWWKSWQSQWRGEDTWLPSFMCPKMSGSSLGPSSPQLKPSSPAARRFWFTSRKWRIWTWVTSTWSQRQAAIGWPQDPSKTLLWTFFPSSFLLSQEMEEFCQQLDQIQNSLARKLRFINEIKSKENVTKFAQMGNKITKSMEWLQANVMRLRMLEEPSFLWYFYTGQE